KPIQLLYCSVQTTTCITTTLLATFLSLLVLPTEAPTLINKFKSNYGSWTDMENLFLYTGATVCLYYTGYHTGKNAYMSFENIFLPEKSTKGIETTTDTPESPETGKKTDKDLEDSKKTS
ncbi:hypothetical protein H0X06_07005, partial [Candidatus Dependentiae bacterium]|nr:hypothetical protein [Candidatus Dependentiae bacterium]